MKKGFTLIELVVVVAVITIVLPSIFAIIYGIVREETKIYRLSKVKKEGDYILNILANTIRNNAVSIHTGEPTSEANEVCKDAGSYPTSPATVPNLYFQDKLSNWFEFSFSDPTVSSISAKGTFNLNSDKVRVSGSLSCERAATYSAPVVSVAFNVCYAGSETCSSTRPEETATLNYQTKIMLRNY